VLGKQGVGAGCDDARHAIQLAVYNEIFQLRLKLSAYAMGVIFSSSMAVTTIIPMAVTMIAIVTMRMGHFGWVSVRALYSPPLPRVCHTAGQRLVAGQ